MAVPVAARVREPADEGLHVERVADVAAADRVPQGREVGVPPPALVHGDRPARLGGRVQHRVGVRSAQRERLLADHVLAGPQAFQHRLRVERRRHADDHQLDGRVGQQAGRAGVRGHREAAGGVGAALGDAVAHAAQLQALDLGGRRGVLAADRAVPVQADPDRARGLDAGRRQHAAVHHLAVRRLGVDLRTGAQAQVDDVAGAGAAAERDHALAGVPGHGQQRLGAVWRRVAQRQPVADEELLVQPGGDRAARHRPDAELGQRRGGARRPARELREAGVAGQRGDGGPEGDQAASGPHVGAQGLQLAGVERPVPGRDDDAGAGGTQALVRGDRADVEAGEGRQRSQQGGGVGPEQEQPERDGL